MRVLDVPDAHFDSLILFSDDQIEKKVGNPKTEMWKLKENVFLCFLIVVKALFKKYKDVSQNLFSIKSTIPKKTITDA
jgi:hypothetical protein